MISERLRKIGKGEDKLFIICPKLETMMQLKDIGGYHMRYVDIAVIPLGVGRQRASRLWWVGHFLRRGELVAYKDGRWV